MGKINGFESALEALRALDRQAQERILADIVKKDPEMAAKLRKSLVVFEDLLKVNPNSFIKFFQSIPDAKWVLALRGKDKDFLDAFLKPLATRKRDLIIAALGHLGPQPVSKIVAVQKEIIDQAIQMESQGMILFVRDEDPLV